MPNSKEQELTSDIKFLLVILLLFIFYPVGLVLMWAWMKWPNWVKIIISLPVLLFLCMIFFGFLFFAGLWHRGMMMRNYGNRFYYYRMMPGGFRQSPANPMNPTETLTPQPTAAY